MIELPIPSGLAPILLVAFLTYCRVQACLLVMPGFSMQVVPLRVRVALALAITPLLSERSRMPGDIELLPFALLCGAEIVTGLVLGGIVRIFAMGLDVTASAIAATASLSQIIGVTNEFAPHPIGNILNLAGIALLMALGYPQLLCDFLHQSLSLRPIGHWPEIAELVPHVLGLLRRAFILALLLASPFILGGLLFQLLSGIVSKAMPALPVMFVAAPAAILMALLALVVLAPAILSIWAQAVLDVMISIRP
ncbi:flagellar biosynthetic protein FliR [Paracoccus sp. MBLB3053]|uniref:Flagellar biosynthetic protein FliR n=1 Tax=Paracoccus aurantius TaxID=3073814 RepID=A0ABU2HPG8_9RHOB|nr:flagellar biosynthetic protein FliR [Paracoccus sp. MBLB3053]MDS9466946.1 flagellar biosynthetic protein FliR [Paracoccus sp. MBLB3053]